MEKSSLSYRSPIPIQGWADWEGSHLGTAVSLKKCELKPAPTQPSAALGQITPSSNNLLLHPYPPTSRCNGTRPNIESPKPFITTPAKNSLSSIQAITTQPTRPKRRAQLSYNLAYSWWRERGNVEVTTLTCRINNKNNTYQFNSPSWQTKSKMGVNPIPNL